MKEELAQFDDTQFIGELKAIVRQARQLAYSAVNYAQVSQNWLIGQKLVMQEQRGEARAEYGKRVVELASQALTAEYGRGFSQRNLWKFKQFYLLFNDLQILPTVSAEFGLQKLPTPSAELISRLSWSHFERLMRVGDATAREWYMKEAAEQMWSYRTLDRNVSTMYYHRMLASQQQDTVEQEMKDKTRGYQNDKLEFIKNPTGWSSWGCLLIRDIPSRHWSRLS